MHPGAIVLLGGQGKATVLPASSSQHRESKRKHPICRRPPCTPTAVQSPQEQPQGLPSHPLPMPSPQRACRDKRCCVHNSSDRLECRGVKKRDFASKFHDLKRQRGSEHPFSSLAVVISLVRMQR